MFVWVLATIWVGILLQRNPSGHSRLSFLCSCVPESKEFQRKLDSHVHEGSFRELEQGKAQQANLNNTQWYWLDARDVLKKVLCFPISVMVTGKKKKYACYSRSAVSCLRAAVKIWAGMCHPSLVTTYCRCGALRGVLGGHAPNVHRATGSI